MLSLELPMRVEQRLVRGGRGVGAKGGVPHPLPRFVEELQLPRDQRANPLRGRHSMSGSNLTDHGEGRRFRAGTIA